MMCNNNQVENICASLDAHRSGHVFVYASVLDNDFRKPTDMRVYSICLLNQSLLMTMLNKGQIPSISIAKETI